MASRYCTSLVCPRDTDATLPYSVPSHQLERDATGHFWCNYCTRRCALMNWGSDNRWPSVRVQGQMRYAIYGDDTNWLSSIMASRQDMIDALYETLIEQKRAQLPALEYPKPGEEKAG